MLVTLARAVALIAAVVVFAALRAHAAVQLEPGLWQDVETGKNNGKTTKPEVHTTCMSPEEARDPVKTILKDSEGQKCDKYDVKENGNTVTAEIRCGDPKEMRMEIDMTINFVSTKHYYGTMKSLVIFKGIKSASEATINSTWLSAACKQ
jgi:hypothetical protein